jgi:hypothetical protein
VQRIDLLKLPPKVFISYSHADRGFVEKLAYELAQNRIVVWWDEWEIRVGDSLLQKIEYGITNTSYLVVILSNNSVSSAWVQEELRAALTRQLAERKTIVLPVLLDDCEIPLFLRDKKYADFRKDHDFGLENLVHAIAAPDIGNSGREDVKEYFNDYAMDWYGTKEGIFALKIDITSHSPKLPYSVKALITATATEALSKRFRDYIRAGFPWAIPIMLLIQIHDAIREKAPILLIEGDSVASEDFGSIDPRHGTGADIHVEARRMGADLGDDILYEWGTILLYILESQREKIMNTLPIEEIKRWERWFVENPVESL